MKQLLRLSAAFIIAACFTSNGFAYEFENGVPLTLGFQLGETTVKGIHLRLTGHDVEMAISLRNDTRQAQYAGFYANTPLFENHGEGEENSDKSFADLKAFHDGKPVQSFKLPARLFPGAGHYRYSSQGRRRSSPSNNGDWEKEENLPLLQNQRIQHWQGQVSFGWSAQLAPDSTAIETIKYTALPKFSLEAIDSESLAQLVQQHCGSPARLRQMIHRAAPKETLVLAEVFEFPLPFIALQETRVTVGKPDKKLPGGRRFATLACGFDGAKAVPSGGMIRRATYSISILVVSLLE